MKPVTPVAAGKNIVEINTSDLPDGLYLYKVRTERQRQETIAGKISIFY